MLNKLQLLSSILFTYIQNYHYIRVKYITSKLTNLIYKLYSYIKYD